MEGNIQFFYEEITGFILPEADKVKAWLTAIIEKENNQLSQLNYIFCNDEYLHKINIEYLDHDTYTDIITFDNSEEEGIIEGDVFLSVDRIRENAKTHNIIFVTELHRVLAHGALHLLGYNDKTEQEKAEMRKKEEACLSLYLN